jgi:hypothetical protein
MPMPQLTANIECPRCGDRHTVLLDGKGRFDCELPCEPDSGDRLVGSIDAESWMLLQQQLTHRIVH